MLVGLMLIHMLTMPELSCMSTSWKMMIIGVWFDVNLMLYLVYRFVCNLDRESGPLIHGMKISSINQNQVKGLNGEDFRWTCSSCPMNMYEGQFIRELQA